MARIFEKARRFFVEGSKEYGDVLLLQVSLPSSPLASLETGSRRQARFERRAHAASLCLSQRLYQTISSPNPISTTPATNFASLTAGPGVARPLKTGETAMGDPLLVTSLRLNTKDRDFLAEAYYKGVTYHPGESDALLLCSPKERKAERTRNGSADRVRLVFSPCRR